MGKVRKVMKIAQEPISLETPIGEEEDSHLGDFIEDKGVVSPVEQVVSQRLKETVNLVLQTLTEREEKVLRMRFGVGDEAKGLLQDQRSRRRLGRALVPNARALHSTQFRTTTTLIYEVVVKRSETDVCRFGDLLDARSFSPPLGDQPDGGVHESLSCTGLLTVQPVSRDCPIC